MPDPEWHAGKSATHLLNIKLLQTSSNENTHRGLDTEYLCGDVGTDLTKKKEAEASNTCVSKCISLG